MQREVALFVGKTGTGKTTAARKFIKTQTRVIVADAGFNEFGVRAVATFSELCAVIGRPFFRVAYDPYWWEWPYLFDACRVAGETGGPVWLVLEEADRIDDPRRMQSYDDAINRGRHWGLNILAISTRPSKLPIDYRAQATWIKAFRQHEPRDIDYLAEIMGERAEELPELGPHAFIEWRHGEADAPADKNVDKNSLTS